MDAILQAHNNTMPAREVLVALAEKFRWALSNRLTVVFVKFELIFFCFFYKTRLNSEKNNLFMFL